MSESRAAWAHIDEICDAFEQGWKADQAPAIEDIMAAELKPLYDQLLLELLHLELHYRDRRGDVIRPDEYRRRFPDGLSQVDAAFNKRSDALSALSTLPVGKEEADESSPQTPAPDSCSTTQVQSSTDPAPGQLISARYHVLGQVGKGGMGVVYRAIDRKFERHVALKVLLPGQSNRRFQREAKLLGRIDSPHVVKALDLDQLADGRPMLCMEWVEGADLRQVTNKHGGKLPEPLAVRWMRHTCRAMLAAAELGIIHRDLKPSNILIDTQGRARVADFGLAFDIATLSDISNPGAVLGTVRYISPELAEDPRGIDSRADIYSFGATFYHVLTGGPPFDGPTPFAILYKHKTEPLVSLRTKNPELSARTCELIERCLAKAPSDRFQSFAEVAAQLERAPGDVSPWDTSDDPRLAPYLDAYRARRAVYLEGEAPLSDADVFTFAGGRQVRMIRGNLAEQDVDAIVSSDDEYLSMGGGVSLEIVRKGGEVIEREARRYAPVRPGRAVVTSAGKLKARFVFHGITLGMAEGPTRDVIAEIMRSCFYHADSLRVRRIAFSLLGTGSGGFPRDVCLDTMFRLAAGTMLAGASSLAEVRIVLFSPVGSASRAEPVTTTRPARLAGPTDGPPPDPSPRRVRLTIPTKTRGKTATRELPFVVGILGDFGGEFGDPARSPRTFEVRRGGIDKVMAAAGPRLKCRVSAGSRGGDPVCRHVGEPDLLVSEHEIRFSRLADFQPLAVARQVPPLAELLASIDRERGLKRDVTALESEFREQLAALIHAPPFLRLEAAWRGIVWLAGKARGNSDVVLRLLDCPEAVLERELSDTVGEPTWLGRELCQTQISGAEPAAYSLLVINRDFGPDDLAHLEKLADFAAAANCPLVAGASPGLLGLDSLAALSALRAAGDRMGAELSARWESLRARPEMQYAALALPRVLAREPYMGQPSRRRGAAFFETHGSSPLPIEHGCWLSAAWAFAANVISAQARDGWCTRICGPNVGRLTDLPSAYLPGDLDGPELRPVDVNIKYHLDADLGRLGLAPLIHFRNAGHAAFHHASAVHARRADGPPQNAGQARRTVAFAGVMAASRLMHGIRIMVCQGLREGKTISGMAAAANEWLRPYTSNREPEVESFNSGALLREGRVEIQSVAGEPGMVEIQAELAPWVPGEPLPQMVRMTARVRSS